MRVLHLLRPAAIGGCEQHLLSLLPYLRERGHEVVLVLLAREEPFASLVASFRGRGVDVRVVRPGPHLSLLKPVRLWWMIRRAAPDLVHTHSMDGDVYGQIAARLGGVPAVSTIHGTYPFYRREPYRTAARLACALSRRTIAISDHVVRFLDEVGIAGPGRVERIHYGIDVAHWPRSEKSRRATRADGGARPDDVVVGVTSRLVEAKGHRVLLDALAEAAPEAPALKLWVAGDGPLGAELREHALRRLPSDRVRFCGFVHDMPAFLAACDALVFPSLPAFGEGFGMSALEGMAAGLPVVATRLDSLPELVVHGRTGLLVEPGSVGDLASALVELAGDPDRRREMGRAGRERAQARFPDDAVVERTTALYEEVLTDGRGPGEQPTRGTWDQVWRDRQDLEEVYSNRDRIGRQLEGVADLRGARVLEVGAGTGRDGAALTERGARVVLTDYSPTALGLLARLRGRAGLHVMGADAFRLGIRDGAFDVVFHQGLLEHFQAAEARTLLEENIRVLRRGGLLVVDVPQRFHPYTLLKHVLIAFGRWFAGWERSFSEPELRRLLVELGLSPVRSYGEWMVPSLPYRVIRQGLRRFGIRLPLYPRGPLSRLRDRVRAALYRTRIPLYSGISIGVIARKPDQREATRASRGPRGSSDA